VVRASSNSMEAEAELIRLVWQGAPSLSLVHDVSDGGVETALREMAEWSRVTTVSDVPDPDSVRFVLAGATVPDFAEEVGEV